MIVTGRILLPIILIPLLILGSCRQNPKAAKESEPREETQLAALQAKIREDPCAVAAIGPYIITREELRERLRQEITPSIDRVNPTAEVEPMAVLQEMISEKAMILEGKKQHVLEEPQVRDWLKKYRQEKMIELLMENATSQHLVVTDEEVQELLRQHPQATPEQARQRLVMQQKRESAEKFLDKVSQERDVELHQEHFTAIKSLHDKLLAEAADIPTKADMDYIRLKQVQEKIPQEVGELVVAEFKGGKVTIQDWFNMLVEFSPPSRPEPMDRKGIETVLKAALRKPLLLAEAQERGFDQDRRLDEVMEKQTEAVLSGMMQRKQTEHLQEQSIGEALAFFMEHQERFYSPAHVKMQAIWTQDKDTAEKVKAELAKGRSWEALREQFAMNKDNQPDYVSGLNQGIFFNDFQQGQVGDLIGPVRGFYHEEPAWCVAKILEKEQRRSNEMVEKLRALAEQDNPEAHIGRGLEGIINAVKWQRLMVLREEVLSAYYKELLERYDYVIDEEKVRATDPRSLL